MMLVHASEVALMVIADLLKHKGSSVVTVTRQDTIATVLGLLAEFGIGAVVVTDTGTGSDVPIGIVSERDIVRRLNERGAALLEATVEDVMTAPVITCSPGDQVESVALLMTERRFRHMPVISGGHVAGIVTIGDVVAARIRQLEIDRVQLESYIASGA